MIKTTIPNSTSKSARWRASAYTDDTRPSIVFHLAAGLAILLWLLLTGWIVAKSQTVGSPDEAANRYFMSVLAQTGQYLVDSGLPSETLQYFHPRSMAIQGQFLAPGSFLGPVQVGAVAMKLFGLGAEKFLTPLLSLGGLVAVFFIFRRFWGRWWALLGASLIAIHPAFFEFSTLPYLHNGVFVATLMIAAWATLRLLERPSWLISCLVGLAYGGALFFRPIEILWTAPALTVLLLSRKLWRELLLVGLVMLVVQLPWLIGNNHVYGSWLASGYAPGGFTGAEGEEVITAAAGRLLTPPGGWSWHWLSSAWWYFVLFLPTWSAMALIAIGRYFGRKYVSWSKSLKLTAITLIGIFPLIYYGTWNLYPTTPSSDVGALASYVRYWLPLYVVMAPGVIVILRLLSRRWLVGSLTTVMVLSQVWIIWSHPVSGLKARLVSDKKNRAIREQVVAATESNAVMIAGHADKYFQDQRLSGFRLPKNDAEWKILRELVSGRPVYLYVAVGAVDTDQAQTAMSQYGMKMEQKLTISRDGLWKLTLAS